jgi:hypothetical protein
VGTREGQQHHGNAKAGLGFFGIELEALKIGDSLPAPDLKLVVRPNDWPKTARLRSRIRSPDFLSAWDEERRKRTGVTAEMARRLHQPRNWAFPPYAPLRVARAEFPVRHSARPKKMIS